VYIDRCGNKRGLVSHSYIVSSIVAITNRLILLISPFPGKKNPEEYSCLPIPVSGTAEEVQFG
jgi:hypothetical protein